MGLPFTTHTAREAARRRWELAKVPDFAKQELEFVATEAFKPFDEGRRGLLAAKISELVALTNSAAGVGISTTARGYAWLVAFGEFFAVRAASTGSDEDAERARRFFKDASIELAKAHELARAEAAARRDAAPALPWFTPAKPEQPRPARKRRSPESTERESTAESSESIDAPARRPRAARGKR